MLVTSGGSATAVKPVPKNAYLPTLCSLLLLRNTSFFRALQLSNAPCSKLVMWSETTSVPLAGTSEHFSAVVPCGDVVSVIKTTAALVTAAAMARAFWLRGAGPRARVY